MRSEVSARALIVFVLGVVLSSCRAAAGPTAGEAASLDPGRAGTAAPTVVQSTGPSESPSPTAVQPTAPPPAPSPAAGRPTAPESEAAPPACREESGTLVKFSLRPELLSSTLAGTVYLPPCYGTQSAAGYPVLYLLHGITETEEQWLRMGLRDQADRLILDGEIPPLIIVMPRETTWELPPGNPYGRAVVEELVPWMDEHYLTRPGRDFRAVGGVSRGGNWAFRLGLTHPQTFGAVGVHSAPLFYGDQHRISGWLDEIPEGDVPHLYLDTGEDDQQGELTREVERILTRENVAHSWHLFPGTHNLAYWSAHLEDYLRWYSSTWRE